MTNVSHVQPAVALGSAASGLPPLLVPDDFRTRLETAEAEGVADAEQFAREHTPAERWLVPQWALHRMKWPPKTDAEDLAYLHRVAATRTKEGVAAAQYWAKHGLTDEWEGMLRDYVKRVGPSQARAATKLLHDAMMMVNEATQVGKAAAARSRPFVVDPTLPLAVDKPGNSPSYPSGHTSAAYAAGLVLAHLMPDRRDEFLGLAREASWSRIYGGVHFPTDVLAGAKLATTIVSYLVKQSMAGPVTGTAPGNSGVAGGRRTSLHGAASLPGPSIAGAPTLGDGAGAVMGAGQPGSGAAA